MTGFFSFCWWSVCCILCLSACALTEGYPDGPTPLVPDGAPDLWTSDLSAPDTSKSDQQIAPEDAGLAPHLQPTHSGWRDPLCLSCHNGSTTRYPHPNSGYSAPDCTTCHGFNGAPHQDHAVAENPQCNQCHTVQQVAHVEHFALPDECIQCHYHPKSPEGR